MGKVFLVMMLEETHHTFLDWIVLYQKVTSWIRVWLNFFFFLLSTDLLTRILVPFTLQPIILFILFRLCYTTYGVLVSWPELKFEPPALETWSINHWTHREVLWLDLKEIWIPCIGSLEY